jgi:hypothetical protein
MRIRASVLTPILAMLTVIAIVGVGIALGQSRRGEANATLLESMPVFAAAATTGAAAPAEIAPLEVIQPVAVQDDQPSGVSPTHVSRVSPSAPAVVEEPDVVVDNPEVQVDEPEVEVDEPEAQPRDTQFDEVDEPQPIEPEDD